MLVRAAAAELPRIGITEAPAILLFTEQVEPNRQRYLGDWVTTLMARGRS